MLRAYQRGWLRGDVLAGVTVAAYLIPQVMAYAEVAGLPAVAGLWAAMASLVVYAVLGSSPQLLARPEPPPPDRRRRRWADWLQDSRSGMPRSPLL